MTSDDDRPAGPVLAHGPNPGRRHDAPPGRRWRPGHATTTGGAAAMNDAPDPRAENDSGRASTPHTAPGGSRRRPRWRWPAPHTAVPLVLMGLGAVTIAALTTTVVWTRLGQRADERSRWSMGVPDEVGDALVHWLDVVSVGLVAGAIVACVLVAAVRRAWAWALGASVLIAGANISTQVLKAVIPRPSYGIGLDANSLPSGHTTVMVSLCLAATLVLPRFMRAPMVFVTSAVGTLTGAATLIQRWHRPSDVIAAVAVCGAWAGVGLLVAGWVRRRATPQADATAAARSRPRWYALIALAGAVAVGAYLLTGGLVAHGEPTNVLVGATVLTACGLVSACAAVLVAHGADLVDGTGPRRRRARS